MATTHQLLISLFLALILSGCATQKATGTGGDRAPGRGLMGADDAPLTDVWKDWDAAGGPSTPATLAESASAFDYWQITDEPFVEEAWTAMFAVLTEFRSQSSGEYDETFRTLMTVLEEDEGPRRFDLTFVVSKSGTTRPWEGVIARVYRELPDGSAPGVSVLMRRWEGGDMAPEAVGIWFFSGFSQSPSLSATVAPGGGRWTASLTPGITLKPGEALDSDQQLVASILVETFWRRLVGSEYMETEMMRRKTLEPTPGPHPIAAGLELGDREIDQVFSDSVFAPRLTDFPSRTTP